MMMKSKRKLVLRQETVRAIAQTELTQARGGIESGGGDNCVSAAKICHQTNLNPTTAGG